MPPTSGESVAGNSESQLPATARPHVSGVNDEQQHAPFLTMPSDVQVAQYVKHYVERFPAASYEDVHMFVADQWDWALTLDRVQAEMLRAQPGRC